LYIDLVSSVGKFVTEFIDVPEYLGLPSEFWAASLLMLIAILYTVVSGFTTVVYTDVYQSVFIFSSFLIVGLMGLSVTLPSHFFVYLPYLPPSGYNHTTMLEINVTRTEWSSAFPPNSLNLPPEATYSMYNSFQAIIATYLLLQCTRSASGPGGSGLQTVLATKSEKEVRSQTFLAMMLLTLRWVFSGGVAVLGIQLTLDHGGLVIDPERVVPIVIDKVLPIGIKGFVLASLLAAALTTFDTTINAASAYWTVDIYQALINPRASDRKLLLQARLSTVIVMLFGVLISLQVNTINRIWGFMTIAMAGGFVWPFFFSWYWARFNAYGCFFGIASGFIAAISIFMYVNVSYYYSLCLLLKTALLYVYSFDPLLPEIHAFFITCSTSGLISISICLLTPPVSNQIQRRFYRFARPPGMWKEIKTMCFSSKEIQDINHENRTDLACTFLIGITQLAAYLFAVSFVSKAWIQAGILVVILATTSPIIYFKWYLKLADQPTGGLVKNDLHEDLLFS
jgi:Na+/proline symporter